MFYNSWIQYMDVGDLLHLKQATYWIHSKDEASDSCFYLKKHQGIFVGKGTCDVKHYVVCTHSVNTSLPFLDQNFMDMISNMTVSYRNTSKWLNKLICADDERTSAQVVGNAGVAMLVIILLFFVFPDVQRVLVSVNRILKRD
ncbi:hypothetical protein ACF0H5_009519 [Mactra antiquata]